MKKFISEIKRIFTEINNEINYLWQSKDENFKEMKLGGILIFLCSALPLIIIILSSDNDIDFIRNIGIKIFIYLAYIFTYLSIGCITTYFYIFNSIKVSKGISSFIIMIYKIVLIFFAICAIPSLILLHLIGLIISYRAKNIDRLIKFLLLVIFSLVIVLFLQEIDIYIVTILSNYLNSVISDLKPNRSIIQLTIFFLIIKCEIDLITKIILVILKKKSIDNINKKTITNEENREMNTQNSSKDKYSGNVEEDLNYLKKSIWKFQLATLIIIFFLAMVSSDLFNGFKNSDVKDVCTLITLGMLYWDKRKEWK